jgi:cobalt-zinc-cadmium efflux system protein
MGHDHGASSAGAHRGRLVLVFLLTTAVLIAEVIGGLVTGSLALLADAGHMLTDAAGIGLALLAIWFGARPATPERTFGYYRVEILAAVVNAVLLFGVAGFVLVEAWRRLREPPEIASGLMLMVALVGLAANAVSMLLLRRGQAESLNLRGAYLEVVADAIGSVGVLVGAAIIAFTSWYWVDSLIAVGIGIFILPRAYKLGRDALRILVESAPAHIDVDDVAHDLETIDEVVEAHDLHVWTITSGMDAVSVHLQVRPGTDMHAVLDQAREVLRDRHKISHATVQVEPTDHTGCNLVQW